MMLQAQSAMPNFALCLRHGKINKFLPAVLLLLLLTVKSTAQDYIEDYHLFVGGLVGGANFTQVDGDGYKGYDKVGATFGGILFMPLGQLENLPLPGTAALSLEVLYSQKGAKGMDPVASANLLSQTIDLKYAEVPILINYYNGPRKSMIGIGFAPAYLGYSQEVIETYGGTRYKFPFRKFELNFVMSVNVHIWNGFFINPRFEYSMFSIRKKNEGLLQFGNESQYNNVLSLRLMYLFGKSHS